MGKSLLRVFLVVALICVNVVNGFVSTPLSSSSAGGAFTAQRQQTQSRAVAVQQPRSGVSSLHMGGKMAKFGIFSPVVIVGKIALGDKKFNGLRGKAISLHSQAIGDFCTWAGAYHLRTRLVKKAKTNGDTLGFLV